MRGPFFKQLFRRMFTFNSIMLTSIWIMLAVLLMLRIEQDERTTASVPENKTAYSQAGTAVDDRIANGIRRAMPGTKIDGIFYTPVRGLYQISLGKNVLYTDHSGNYLLIGHLYDMKRRLDLTQQVKRRLSASAPPVGVRKIPWSSLPLQAAVRYGNPDGKKIAIFHDPDCTYCTRLKKELAGTTEFDVYQIMYPIVSLHPGAYRKSKKILCAYKSRERQNNASAKHSTCDAEKLLEQVSTFARKHRIAGTPVIVAENGNVVLGYRPPAELAKLLWK